MERVAELWSGQTTRAKHSGPLLDGSGEALLVPVEDGVSVFPGKRWLVLRRHLFGLDYLGDGCPQFVL